MSETVVERHKSGLRRSKSVRASLRLMGTRFLNYRSHDNHRTAVMQRSPSLSSVQDNPANFKRNYFTGNLKNVMCDVYVGPRGGDIAETILKTPMVSGDESKNRNLFRKIDLLKAKDKIEVSTPPLVVAPKAAAILQIPAKKYDPVLAREFDVNRNERHWGLPKSENDVIHRNSLRLSISSRRKAATCRDDTRSTLFTTSRSHFNFHTFNIN